MKQATVNEINKNVQNLLSVYHSAMVFEQPAYLVHTDHIHIVEHGHKHVSCQNAGDDDADEADHELGAIEEVFCRYAQDGDRRHETGYHGHCHRTHLHKQYQIK